MSPDRRKRDARLRPNGPWTHLTVVSMRRSTATSNRPAEVVGRQGGASTPLKAGVFFAHLLSTRLRTMGTVASRLGSLRGAARCSLSPITALAVLGMGEIGGTLPAGAPQIFTTRRAPALGDRAHCRIYDRACTATWFVLTKQSCSVL